MLVITEKIKFQDTRQHPDESIVQFVHRLKERARYRERLGTGEMTTNDLVMLRLIEGTHDPALKRKLLEMFQSVNLSVEICIEFVQQLELIKKYIANNRTKEKRTAQIRNSMQILWRTA